jgi:hypothetical protein
VPGVSDEGSIPGFKVKSLRYPDGRRFIPQDLRQSNCYLDRVLPENVRNALYDGAVSAVSLQRGKAEARLESLFDKTNDRLESLFAQEGMHPGTGMPLLLSYLQTDYELKGFHSPEAGSLEMQAFATGIYTENSVLSWLWISYLQHLGVPGFRSEPLVQPLQQRDRAIAPPADFSAPGCEGGIAYRWPTLTRPIDTFADSEPDSDVHWGVCKATNKVWVYHWRRGWRPADSQETAEFCGETLERPVFFDKIC